MANIQERRLFLQYYDQDKILEQLVSSLHFYNLKNKSDLHIIYFIVAMDFQCLFISVSV